MLILPVVVSIIASYALVPALQPILGQKQEKNYAGHQVPTGLGLTFVFSAVLGWMAFPDVMQGQWPAVVVVLGFGLLGLIDDLLGDRMQRGFRGHLSAFVQGRLTTGALKAFGGAVLALLVARLTRAGVGFAVIQALLMVLMANFINLLDLRPGRAGKVVVCLSLPLVLIGSKTHWLLVLIGAVIGYLPWDLREKAMMGDTGANALGAALGFAMAASLPVWLQIAILLALAFLNLASERVSFSRIIAQNRVLRWLDELGRTGGE